MPAPTVFPGNKTDAEKGVGLLRAIVREKPDGGVWILVTRKYHRKRSDALIRTRMIAHCSHFPQKRGTAQARQALKARPERRKGRYLAKEEHAEKHRAHGFAKKRKADDVSGYP